MNIKIAILLALAIAIGGCKAGYDNTVLPGDREDAIPGRSVFPAPGEDKLQKAQSDPGAPAADSAPEDIAVAPICPDPTDKSDPNCTAGEAPPAADGTFSDGQ